jgi:glycosyltransferase involved in cell wall biosynthesis
LSPGSQRVVAEREAIGRGMTAMRSEPVRVCHIASGDRWAGAEAQVAALLAALSKRNDVRVSAIFLNEGRLAAEARRAGVDVCVLPESEFGFFGILDRAAEFLRGKNFRILHSHRYKENLLATMLSCRCNVPLLVRTQHGAPEPFAGWRRSKQNMIGVVDRFTARHFTDCVIGVSEELRGGLGRYVPADRLAVIHNAIDTEAVTSALTVSEAKARLGLASESPVVGVAGRLEPIKRLDIFLEAARQIANTLPDARFVIAGEGRKAARLRRLAGEVGLGGSAMFLGQRDDVYDVLRAMDVLVLCSDHEGLPTSLLEALYLRVPVVARAVGGIPEVIEDGVSGVLVNTDAPSTLAQECLSLLADEKRRKQMSVAGAQRVARAFSIEGAASEMAGLYRRLGGRR